MIDTEMFTIQNTLIDPTLYHHFSTFFGKPADLNTTNYYKLESIERGEVNNTYKISRPLITPWDTDYKIPKQQTVNMVYANGPSVFSKHKYNGWFTIFIWLNGVIDVGVDLNAINFHKIHGIVMYCIWGWMSFFMLITGRHLKLFYRARQIFHALCGTVMLVCTIISI
jgi:hypothetical protein